MSDEPIDGENAPREQHPNWRYWRIRLTRRLAEVVSVLRSEWRNWRDGYRDEAEYLEWVSPRVPLPKRPSAPGFPEHLLHGSSLRQLKNAVRHMEREGNWYAALEVYREILRRSEANDGSLDVTLLNRIGDLHRQLAADWYSEAVDRYAERGLRSGAIALCRKALRLDEDRPRVRDRLEALGGARPPARAPMAEPPARAPTEDASPPDEGSPPSAEPPSAAASPSIEAPPEEDVESGERPVPAFPYVPGSPPSEVRPSEPAPPESSAAEPRTDEAQQAPEPLRYEPQAPEPLRDEPQAPEPRRTPVRVRVVGLGTSASPPAVGPMRGAPLAPRPAVRPVDFEVEPLPHRVVLAPEDEDYKPLGRRQVLAGGLVLVAVIVAILTLL